MKALIKSVFSSLSIGGLLGLNLIGTTPAWALGALNVHQLRCEYAVNPLGIDVIQPRLSWTLESNQRGQRQTAFQILVATSAKLLGANQGDLWDSGKVASDQSTQVVYGGKPLPSRQRCYWQVRAWDQNDLPSDYCAPAYWEMGLLKPEDWQAQWIGFTPSAADQENWQQARWIWFPEGNPAAGAPVGERFFRRAFTIPPNAVIKQARTRFTADDQFLLYINGKLASQSSGKPYAWKILTETDVKSFLTPGLNMLAIAVTNQASAAGLLGQLAVEFEAGPALSITTDKSWKVSKQLEPGWPETAFNDQTWPATMEVAKLGEGPWQGTEFTPLEPCPFLRKTIAVAKPIKQARLYASALGVYEFHLNGQRVGRDYFNPGWTDYRKRVQYHTYDVTSFLKRGDNALGIVLGDGWYAGYVGLGGRNRYGQLPLALGQLQVDYQDGTTQTFVTDSSWRATTSPILQSDMLMGETYDARKEVPGWDKPEYRDTNWHAVITKSVQVPLVAAADAPVRKTLELKSRIMREPKPGVFVFDLGQNMVGWVHLRVKGPAGTQVTLRFAEMLNPDGTIYTTNLRSAKCTDHYILKGVSEEVFEPHFTFHGFRYVELTGYPGRPALDAVTGIVVHSDTPPGGNFACSNPDINQLEKNITWGQRGNFLSIPTDCPQRDERLGWMGDAQVFIRTATCNMDVSRFFTKWLVDVDDAQTAEGAFTDVSPFVAAGAGTAAWGDAGVICPWTLYLVYGDTRILERHYAAGAKWIEYLKKHSTNLLRPAQGYGDWLSIQADTPKDVLATAYFACSTRIMAKMAKVLGKADDAQKYEDLFQQIKTAFNKAYVAPDGRIKGNTQTCYVLALSFDLLPEDKRATAAKYLVDDIANKQNHLSTGFVGVGHLCPVLTQAGYTDVAYRLLLTDSFPSWLYSIRQGATTIWERWDGWTREKGFQDPGMNSFNHYSLGSVGEWLFDTVAGIGLDPEKPGWQHIIIHPRPGGGLTYAKADYDSIRGKIVSDWKLSRGTFTLKTIIPANSTATVYVPAQDANAVKEGNQVASSAPGVKFLRVDKDCAVFAVGSGTYQFSAPATP